VNFPLLNQASYQDQHLEHILPQAGENALKEDFPHEYDYENTVYRLGNLTLLEGPINQSLNYSNDISSGEWFKSKRGEYVKSGILLTKSLTNISVGDKTAFNTFISNRLKFFEVWGMREVAERQEILRGLILEVWRLELIAEN
jgi:hypothetical protein